MAYIKLEDAIEALNKCQSVPGSTFWRTQDPPGKEANYLVTDNEGNLDICLWTNEFFGKFDSNLWHWKTGTYQKVIAWMPLPEAYTGGMEEGRK